MSLTENQLPPLSPEQTPADTADLGAPIVVRHGPLGRLIRNSYFRGLLLPIAILVVWELVTATNAIKSPFLPSPAQVFHGWRVWAFGPSSNLTWTSGTYFHFCYLTIRRVFIGFAIGAAFGLTFGILIGWLKIVRDLFDPFIQVLRPIPVAAWLPFATIVFGIGETAAIFVIAMGCFFPIVVNATVGTQQTPRLLVRAALMLGTRPHRVLLRVALPSALPSIMTGLRLGLGVAWVMVIVAEMLAVQGGLGYAIWGAYEYLRMDLILASIISLGIFGWLTDQALVLGSKPLLRWQRGVVHE